MRRAAYFWKFDEMAETDNEVTGGYAYPYFWRKPLLDAAWVPAEMINVDGNKIFWRWPRFIYYEQKHVVVQICRGQKMI